MKRVTLRIQIILLAIGMLLAAMVISAGFTLSRMNGIGIEIRAITGAYIPLTEIITNITIHQLEKAIWFERALRSAAEMKDGNTSENFTRAQEAFTRLAHLVEDEIARGKELTGAAIEDPHNNESQRAFEAEILGHLQVIEQKHGDYSDHVAALLEAIARGTAGEFKDAVKAIEAEEDLLDSELETFLRTIEDFTEASLLHTRRAEENVIFLMRAITVFSLVFGIAISILLMMAGFRKPIIVEMDDAGGLVKGHLFRHSHKDENR